ncbi:6-aminohexanoate hydrolase, partial [Escherichia coli]|nr:6-aminohexanoate hydrolase [Escherichia coli]
PKTALTIVKFSSSPDFAPRALEAHGEATRPRAALERGDALSMVARAVAEKLR